MEVTSFCSCGFVNSVFVLAIKLLVLGTSKEYGCVFHSFRFVANCAVCLQRSLKVIKVCLLLPFLLKKSSLNSALALKTSKSLIYRWLNTTFSLEMGICQCVQKICEDFRVTPVLFDGDYFWHMKHDASQGGINLVHFEWAFIIWEFYMISLKWCIAMK